MRFFTELLARFKKAPQATTTAPHAPVEHTPLAHPAPGAADAPAIDGD